MSKDATNRRQKISDVQMPDIYDEEYAVDDSFLYQLETDSADEEADDGFDPYDTAVLYKK